MSERDLIAELGRLAAGGGSVDERARQAAALVRAHTGHRWVGIYRVSGQEVVNLAWSGPGPPAHPVFERSQGLTAAAIQAGSAVVSNDVARDPRYLTNQESTGSELIAPVLVDGEVVGTLDVEDGATGAFGAEDAEHFAGLAAALAGLYR